MMKILPALLLACVAFTQTALASEDIPDKYPESPLYDRPTEVVPGVVWSAIGATAPPTFENTGHNNNLSFIVTSEGVVVVNGGAAYILAKALHEEIKKLTDQPVVLVIDENGQGHAMLGNSYWQEQGVTILAHSDAAHEFEDRGFDILDNMKRYNRDKSEGSFIALPTETFEDSKTMELGGVTIEVINFGPAHSPGDISVWLPQHSVVIAGDMAFHQRMLPVFDDTDTGAWLESWEKFAALEAEIVIPGHGEPTTMEEVTKYTKDYLVYMREQIEDILDNDGDLGDASKIDQSAYAHLDTFEQLAGRNASRIFQQMEFEAW